FHIERHDGGGIGVLGIGAITAPIVDGRIAHRHIDEAQFVVARGDGPHIWRAGRIDFALRRQSSLAWTPHVPRPVEGTGYRVEAADDAGRRFARLSIADLTADDQ